MNVLITGGCGFLGFAVAQRVLLMGGRLTVIDNLSRVGSRDNLSSLETSGSFTFVPGDVRDRDLIADVVGRIHPEVIYHLGAQVAMTTSLRHPRFDFDVNAGGTINVLEAVRARSPRSIVIYSSTNKVYGDLDYLTYRELETRYEIEEFPDGLDESTPLDFSTPYGCSKGAADRYVADYARNFGLRTVVLRHSSIYGANQRSTVDQGWVGWFLSEVLALQAGPKGKPIAIAGNGKQVRDLLYCTDAADLYLRVPEYADGVSGQCFNVGGGKANAMSILELIRFAEMNVGVTVKQEHHEARKSDQKVFVSNNARVRRSFDWMPSVSYKEGLEKTLDWIRCGQSA